MQASKSGQYVTRASPFRYATKGPTVSAGADGSVETSTRRLSRSPRTVPSYLAPNGRLGPASTTYSPAAVKRPSPSSATGAAMLPCAQSNRVETVSSAASIAT